MKKPITILCPICEDPCGKYYPDSFEEAGWSEGKGEDYRDANNTWCCSQECLEKQNNKESL